jgi:hypothetical protein
MSELEEKKKRKKKGGTRDGKGSKSKGYNLKDWFKGGGWVQVGGKYDGKPCAKQPGQKTKPYCRDPDDRAKMGKKEKEKRVRKKRKNDPNPNRRGKAKNVSQKRKKRKSEAMELSTKEIRIIIVEELQNVLDEKKGKRRIRKKKAKKKAKQDACYHKVKRRYKVWPSAYASGALVRCRKVGAKNWGNKSKKNETIEEQKNCGCGQDPCKTYGKVNEDYSPHDMFDPKTGKKVATKKEKDHIDLAKKGYVHVDPKDIEDILNDEGGASGLDPFLDELGKDLEDDILKALKSMSNVGKHKEGDYILDDEKEVKIMKEATYEDGSPVEESFGFYETLNEDEIVEAEYRGRKVKLNKPMRGDVKKFKVYVKDPKTGNIKKVNFGHGGSSAKRKGEKTMRIRKSNKKRRKSFRARHNCDNPGPKTKARYWSCRKW